MEPTGKRGDILHMAPDDQDPLPTGGRSRAIISSLAAGLVAFAVLTATAAILPMSWDEGNAINRAAGITAWAREAVDQGADAFSAAEIARHWHYTVEIEGHPALYGIVIACGQQLAGGRVPPLTAARLGPMILFSIAVAAMFYRLSRQYSFIAALGGVAALITMPRLFAHAHFASFDGPLTSCWILAWALFAPAMANQHRVATGAARARFSFGWALIWGAALGAAMSCKLTGWLASLPFAAYVLVYGNRKTTAKFGVGLVVALATFWLLNPRLWHHPLDGMRSFFALNLNRAGTSFDIPTLFFGTRYDSVVGLPWYNTIVWTCITVPVGSLVLATIGIVSTIRRWQADGDGVVLLLSWLVLLVVRAVPGTPVHDAERLILPSFAFLAALAGLGCERVWAWASRWSIVVARRPRLLLIPPSVGKQIALAGLVAIYTSSATSLVWYTPQWLSYYNLAIGGLRGADALGMEATYYWDALDDEVLAWLHEHTRADEKIEFAAGSPLNLELLERWGVLKRGWRPHDPGTYRWRVIQRRPTFWSAADRRLIEEGTPAYTKTIRPPSMGFGPWRLDVPLIYVFSHEQFKD